MAKQTKKQYLQQIYQERLNQNHTLPKCPQFENITRQETLNTEHPYKDTTKKLIKLELGYCPECKNKTYCTDYHRGERVCPECGYVYSNTVFEKPRYIPINELENTKQLSYTDKQKLQKNKHFITTAQEWKKRQIKREIDVICSTLMLNKANKEKVIEIITKTGLKKLHQTSDRTTIICAVCRYIMKNQEYKNIVQLRYDRGIFKEKLTRDEYNIIEKNIIQKFGDKYVHKPKINPKKKKSRRRKSKKHSTTHKRRTQKPRNTHTWIKTR